MKSESKLSPGIDTVVEGVGCNCKQEKRLSMVDLYTQYLSVFYSQAHLSHPSIFDVCNLNWREVEQNRQPLLNLGVQFRRVSLECAVQEQPSS